MLKPEQPVQQQPMAPMPFYADPTRFTAPVWQAEPAQTWPQGQFIQQIPASAQPTLEGYPPQQYPNGIYPTTYQQPATFETGTFYTGVQVLTNTRPPSAPNHAQLTPRANGSYSHTPSPVPTQTQSQQATQRTNISGQYHQEYVNNQGYVAPSTPTGGNVDNSRPSSVNSVVNVPTSNQNFQQQANFTSVSSTNFSPGTNTNPNFVNAAGSGNEKPGYPQVNSSPQLVSHSSSGYPGSEYGGNLQQNEQTQHWSVGAENMMWEPNIGVQNSAGDGAKSNLDQGDGHYGKPHDSETMHDQQSQCDDQFSQSNRVNLNSRIKSMILNKQQNIERKLDEDQGDGDNKTGHFLWYSHHRRPPDLFGGGGGVPSPTSDFKNPPDKSRHQQYVQRNNGNLVDPRRLLPQENSKFSTPTVKLKHDANSVSLNQAKPRENNEPPQFYKVDVDKSKPKVTAPKFLNTSPNCFGKTTGLAGNCKTKAQCKLQEKFEKYEVSEEKIRNHQGTEIPHCNCFPPDKVPPEPGSYYTHLGCASTLGNLRKDLETRTGVNGKAIRMEKVCYTGKEGKTAQGCPLAKWIIRRSNYDEKYLIVVKHRQGHTCFSAYIVICIVAWEGVSQVDADTLYTTLTDKLNSYGVATNRRCATNEQRTCACQGLDPKTCGASFSFGCSWSMYYNGCKFARSKVVRKFRLTERSEEENVESRLQNLATHVSPLYKTLAPVSFRNQCEHEDVAGECRLGLGNGKPFSGVTACMDFCAHAHKDSHNMNNGCTLVVSLTKERSLSKRDDEQLHVLPLYTIDGTDEFGSKESQDEKYRNGSIETLNRYECEVRMRTVPLQPCRRRKKKDDDCTKESPLKRDAHSSRSSTSSGYDSSRSQTPQTPSKNADALLQSSHISSTVLDSPVTPKSWSLDGYNGSPIYNNQYEEGVWLQSKGANANNPDSTMYAKPSVLTAEKGNATAFNLTYPNVKRDRFEPSVPPAQTHNSFLLQNKVQDSYSGIRSTNQSLNVNNIDYSTGILNKFQADSDGRSGFSEADFSFKQSATKSPFKIPYIPETTVRFAPKNFPNRYPDEHLPKSDRPSRPNYHPTYDHQTQLYPVHMDHAQNSSPLLFPTSESLVNFRYDANEARSKLLQYNAMLLKNPTKAFQSNGSILELTNDCDYGLPPSPYAHHAPSQALGCLPGISAFTGRTSNWDVWHNQNVEGVSQMMQGSGDLNQETPKKRYGNERSHLIPSSPRAWNTLDPFKFNPNPYSNYQLCNPFDDFGDYGLKRAEFSPNCIGSEYIDHNYFSPSWFSSPKSTWDTTFPVVPEQPTEVLGKVTDVVDNAESFRDSQIGGVAIALGHGSVLFECAKHELHATTALKKPNRTAPTRISLVFYQHRNLNRDKHGWDQWEEKTRLKKLGASDAEGVSSFKLNVALEAEKIDVPDLKALMLKNNAEILLRAPTLTTMSVTTLFPMYPCMVTGPYQEAHTLG